MAERQSEADELREGLEEIRAARRATLEQIAAVGERSATRQPSGGGWSVVQVLDHLIKTDGVYRDEIGKLFEMKAEGREPVREVGLRSLNTRPPFIPAALLPYLDEPFRLINRIIPAALREYLTGVAIIPFKAPDVASPDALGGIDAMRERLRESGEQVAALLEGRDVSGMILDHPMLGRNSVPSLLRILARHEQRHQTQISRILAAEPAAAETPAASGAGSGRGSAVASNGAAAARLEGFAADAETALKTGRQIVAWWKDKALMDALQTFPLKPAYLPYYEMQGFFDEILFMGDMKPTSIMGCLQRHRFKRRRAPAEGVTQHLESFIDKLFLSRSYRVHQDGAPGGFRYRPICFKERAGRLVAPADPEAMGADLTGLRNGVEWCTLRVDILDFVRVNPSLRPFNSTLSRFIRESAYIVIHEDLALETTKAPKGVVAERRFGYAFLPREVEPNMFGFGPGKFGAAIKQWRFLMYVNGDVEVQIAFLVAPRSQKVLDLAGFDPVYASIGLADLFSLGVFGLRAGGHAALDKVFLEHHGSVHADVVLGMAEVWEGQRWTPAFGSW